MSRDSANSRTLSPSTDVYASASIIVARIIYAINWFNVAAIFPLVVLDFGQQHDVSLLGSISAAFFIGVGVFQVPAGIFAARYSPRTSAVFGIGLSSTAALLYGFASDASQLIWLRFIVGAGMAFFFSSGIVLIAKHASAAAGSKNKNKSHGFSIGLMNSAHSAGGIVGLFVWIVIAQTYGWRSSLILSGAMGIASAILMVIAIPPDRGPATVAIATDSGRNNNNNNHSDEKRDAVLPADAQAGVGVGDSSSSSSINRTWPSVSEIWRTLSSPSLIALGLVLTGVQASWALSMTFTVVYLKSLGIALESTGIIASVALVSAIVSAPLIGGFYDRKVKDARKILLVCGVGISIALAAMSIQILPVIIAAVIALGFFSGGAFTVAYAKARTIRTTLPASGKGRRSKRSNDDDDYDNNGTTTSNNNNSGLQQDSRRDEENDEEADANPFFSANASDRRPSYNISALNVAWINGLSLLGVLWMPLAFSLAVKSGGGGYPNAWLLSAIMAALFIFVPLKGVGK
jgi:MFS family permease